MNALNTLLRKAVAGFSLLLLFIAALALNYGCVTESPAPAKNDKSAVVYNFKLCSVAEFEGMLAPDVIDVRDVDVKPRVVCQTAPRYPLELRKSCIGGEAVVGAIVDETGCIVCVCVYSTTRPEFAEAVLTAMNTWRFEPAVNDGKLVKCRFKIPVPFRCT